MSPSITLDDELDDEDVVLPSRRDAVKDRRDAAKDDELLDDELDDEDVVFPSRRDAAKDRRDAAKDDEFEFQGRDLKKAQYKMVRDLEGDTFFEEVIFSWLKQKPQAILPVRSQRRCGVCYAFAFTDAASALHVINGGESISLSKQEYVDLLHSRYDHSGVPHRIDKKTGCGSSNMDFTCKMLQEHGVYEEEYYPYKGRKEKTPTIPEEARAQKKKFFIGGYVTSLAQEVPLMDPHVIDCLKKQPVVGVVAACSRFRKWEGKDTFRGRLSRLSDKGKAPHHLVMIIGHGRDKNGVEYFLIKNSWGKKWGHKGFAKVRRQLFLDIGFPAGVTGFKDVDENGNLLA